MDSGGEEEKTEAQQKNTVLFVSNLPFETTDDDLRHLFVDNGFEVVDFLISRRRNFRSKGFGFVELTDYEKALLAVEQIHKSIFQSRQIAVQIYAACNSISQIRENDTRAKNTHVLFYNKERLRRHMLIEHDDE
jgi:RNA recognition motif-containing protein